MDNLTLASLSMCLSVGPFVIPSSPSSDFQDQAMPDAAIPKLYMKFSKNKIKTLRFKNSIVISLQQEPGEQRKFMQHNQVHNQR